MELKNIFKFLLLIKAHQLLVCNIINMMPYNGCSQMLHISLKTEKSFIAHPWRLLCVVGLEEYSAHDWRAATSVQRAPVTWRQWGLCSWVSSHDNIPAFQFSLFYNLFMPTIKKKIKLCIASLISGESTITDDSPHKGPVMRKVFPHYDIIMTHPGQWITCSLNSQLQCSAVINAVNFILTIDTP